MKNWRTPLRVKLLRVFGFIAAALVTAAIISLVSIPVHWFTKRKLLRAENERMKDRYRELTKETKKIEQQMKELEDRDNEVYRSIFEATPIPDSARLKDLEKEQQIAKVEGMEQNDLINSIVTTLNNMQSRINAQKASYKDLGGMVKDKEKLLAATPAIQPVSNADLKRIASGFGYRIDPVYKTVKLHPGLDFAAPAGTPIYATANGTVEFAGNRGDGYGNNVIINHGYGYKTLFGHMFRIKARAGQRVNRGEVIGWVGSTGKSTGPHCHYEVIKNGNKIDPIYFFYNDLTPEQFDRLLKLAAASNQSFD
jgi:murein DD-endopeptidase MepM/ murein hydrolase activator NlpD